MNPVEYAERKVFFGKSSPISGAFRLSKYPFLGKPLLSLDNIHGKTCVVYKPTQAVGTVFLQIATAYRLDIKRKTVLAVAQTDSDAKEFATIKLNPFLQSIPSLVSTVKKGPYAITLNHWLWATHELIISGPGENAQESKSAAYLHTDEAHLWNVQYPGAMAALENRMGGQWDRAGLHVTTAAEVNTEIDERYYLGRQNEWHQACPLCGKFIWPLWINDDRNPYNGTEIFRFDDSLSQSQTLDSIQMICPHCDKELSDTPAVRRQMDEGADYVAVNPDADRSYDSFRWNCFAPRWKKRRDILAIYLAAVHKAKLGDLAPYFDFVKKQEVRTNMNDFPLMDRSTVFISRDWNEGEEVKRLGATDYQAGKDGEPPHWWVQVDEFARNGDSKRIAYEKVLSWHEVRAMQLDHGVSMTGRPAFASDCGYRDKEVFGRCAEWGWFAMKGDDAVQFEHIRQDNPKDAPIRWTAPYSHPWPGNSTIGKSDQVISYGRRVNMPSGFCLGLYWSNPTIYGLFYALRTGQAGREYGIPKDFSLDYLKQYQAFVPLNERDKVGVLKKTVYKCVKPGEEHAHDTSCMILTLAILHGFYPLDFANSPNGN